MSDKKKGTFATATIEGKRADLMNAEREERWKQAGTEAERREVTALIIWGLSVWLAVGLGVAIGALVTR